MRRKDPISLWQEEGDLELMNIFFQKAEISIDRKERIKQMILTKLDSPDAGEEVLHQQEINDMQRSRLVLWKMEITSFLQSVWWRWNWKLLIPVALLLFVWIGLGTLNGKSLTGQFTHQEMSTANVPKAASAPGVRNGAMMAPASAGDNATSGAQAKGESAKSVSPQSPSGYPAMVAPQPAAVQPSAPQLSASSQPTKGALDTGNAIAAPNLKILANTTVADENTPRKLIQKLSITLEVARVDTAVEQISQKIKQLGGYIVESQVNSSDDTSSGSMRVKIPADKLEEFQGKMPGMGKVLNQYLSGDDVTDQYFDTQTRLGNWESEEQRYLDILKKTNSVEDILKVESYLGNIRMQIDQLKGQLKLLNNQVDFSSIDIQFVPQTNPNVKIYKISDPWQPVAFSATWKSIQNAFLKTISATWNLFNYALVGLGYITPYLILVIGVGGVYYIWRKRRNK